MTGWVPAMSRFTVEWAELCRWLHSIQRDEHANCTIEVGDSTIFYLHRCGMNTVPYPVKG